MRRLLLFVLILVASAVLLHFKGIPSGAADVMEYRGEQIKLSRAYADYDEYKNDPDNIHPSETERVQRLLITAPIQRTFASRVELFRAVGQIKFPGYGTGAGSSRLSDGSELLAVTVEIPRANKDRYLVFRDHDGQYELIDDFVNAEASYPFEIRDGDGAYIYLHDGKELFRRPRR